jgi:hypothetical protein
LFCATFFSRVDYVCLPLLYAWCDVALCIVECLPRLPWV